MTSECVNAFRFGCTCRECWPGYAEVRPYNFPQEWIDRESQEQAKRDAGNFAKLQALMQHESVFDKPEPAEEPAAMPGDPWRAKVAKQIREGANFSTLVLTFDEWQDFLHEETRR